MYRALQSVCRGEGDSESELLGNESSRRLDSHFLSPAEIKQNLPSWVIPGSVYRLAERHWKGDSTIREGQSRRPVPLGMAAGQAIPLALLSTLLLWTFYMSFLPITAHVATCRSKSYASYPLWVWFAFLPVLATCLTLELMCFRLIIVPKYQVLVKYKILGYDIPFHLWLLFATVMSVLAYTEFATVSAFTGTMWITATDCPFGRENLLNRWDYMWQHSVFGMPPPFRATILVVFSLRLAILCHALADSMPLPWRLHEVDYETCVEADQSYETTYETVAESKQNHGAALMALAQANGMNLIFHNDKEYSSKKADNALAMRGDGYLMNALDHGLSQVKRGIAHSLEGVLCNGVMLNFQISIFMLIRSFETPEERDWVPLCYIASSVLQNLIHVGFCAHYVQIVWEWYHKLQEASAATANADSETVQNSLRHFSRRGYVLVLFTVLYTNVVFYALVKMVAGWSCGSHSVWQFSGCLSVPTHLAPK